MKKFIFASDVHGDKQDKRANEALFKFLDIWKPNIRIFGGDLWDFRPLRKGACDDEKRESMSKDYIAGLNWLKLFKPDFFLRGNHDQRLWELAEQDRGVASDYALSGILEIEKIVDEMDCEMLPYDKRSVLKIGHAKFIHGFFAGKNAAQQHATHYGNVIFGHTHTIDEHPIAGLERRVARGVGCLCSLDMEYASRNPGSLRHAHGFCYGLINERTGAFYTAQAEEIDGRWILPTNFIQV